MGQVQAYRHLAALRMSKGLAELTDEGDSAHLDRVQKEGRAEHANAGSAS